MATTTLRPPQAVTAARILAFCVSASESLVTSVAPKLDEMRLLNGINTTRRVRLWMATLATESDFRVLEENLNYSAERAAKTWPSRFASAQHAAAVAHNPSALAAAVYGGRLGNVQPGDGYRFRGRGLMMRTGRAAYAECEAATGMQVLDKPDLLATAAAAAEDAAAFWHDHGCNELADRNDLDGVRHAVNGGAIGLDRFKSYVIKASAVWRD